MNRIEALHWAAVLAPEASDSIRARIADELTKGYLDVHPHYQIPNIDLILGIPGLTRLYYTESSYRKLSMPDLHNTSLSSVKIVSHDWADITVPVLPTTLQKLTISSAKSIRFSSGLPYGLKHLSLTGSLIDLRKLPALPDTLIDLNLSHNKIAHLPKELLDMTGLQSLDVSHNRIHDMSILDQLESKGVSIRR